MEKNKRWNQIDDPKVSIIVLSTENNKLMEKCLNSIQRQTCQNFEVICIDNQDNEDSSETVKRYIETDNRFRLADRILQGTAEMYNEGLRLAKGEFCLFLEGNDFLEKNMLKMNLKKAEKEKADICLSGVCVLGEEELYEKEEGFFQSKYMSDTGVFETNTFPYIFNITNEYLCNKFFRKTLLEKNEIQFKSSCCGIDLYFVFLAMVLSQKVAVISEKYVNHKLVQKDDCRYSKMSFEHYCEMLKLLQRRVSVSDMCPNAQNSFRNMALHILLNSLLAAETFLEFGNIYYMLKNSIFEELGISKLQEEHCLNKREYEIYRNIMQYDVREYMFREIRSMKSKKKRWIKATEIAEKDVKETRNCATLKTGRMILSVPRKIKRIIG